MTNTPSEEELELFSSFPTPPPQDTDSAQTFNLNSLTDRPAFLLDEPYNPNNWQSKIDSLNAEIDDERANSFGMLNELLPERVTTLPLTYAGEEEGGRPENWRDIRFNEDELRDNISRVESSSGAQMWNKAPGASATGMWGQLTDNDRFKELYPGTRMEFAADVPAQRKMYDDRVNKNNSIVKSALMHDAGDLTDEYRPQLGPKGLWKYTYEDIAALSNLLGRDGTRKYFGYVLRDGKSLEEVFPKKYGKNRVYAKNKTPQEYLDIVNKNRDSMPHDSNYDFNNDVSVLNAPMLPPTDFQSYSNNMNYANPNYVTEFKPHIMIDPNTGDEYKANEVEDHIRMEKLGYIHEDDY